jgi:putative ABC transport system permease protein
MAKLLFYLKINFRNLFTNPGFTWINIFGLSVGLTVSLLILLYIRYETSFDNFNPNAGNIYRIAVKNIQDGSVSVSTPLALSDVLKKDYPEIDKVIGLLSTYSDIKAGENRFADLKGAIVEKEFCSFFNFSLQSGYTDSLFNDPFEAVITWKMANQLYGKVNPIGKTFEFEKYTFTVTGIINTIPSNSIFNFDYFLSDKFRYKYYPDLSERWYHFGLYTFVTFKGNRMPSGFGNKLTNIEKQYYPDFMKNRNTYLLADFKGSHLNPSLEGDMVPSVAPGYLWILFATALGILIIACLNFMNISIAKAGKRGIETVVKKVSGAASGELTFDFFAEIAFVVFISILFSFFLVYLLLPAFNTLIEKNITVNLSDPVFFGGIIGFGVLTTVLSGLYPSFVLARPSPGKVLLYKKENHKNRITFQRTIVVLQFTITIILGITQLFIFKQISFMQNHETGFDKKNLISISVRSLDNNGNERLKKTDIFVQTIEKYQAQYGYGKASLTEFVPGFGFRNNFKIFPDGDAFPNGMELLSCDIDENFIDVFGLKIVNGRFFSKDFSTDRDAILINESAYRKLGWQSIDGKSVGLFSSDNRKEIIGVVNDINIRSLQFPIGPMLYQFGRHHMYPGYVTLRLNPDKKAESTDFIKRQWMTLFPDIPFSFESVDEKYNAAYGTEKMLARIMGVFSILSMILSFLGVFALSILEAEKRVKEIGIRKINGARITEVMILLNRDFIKWIAISFIIGCPVAWYTAHRWLQNYAYKTELSWWVFAFAGILALGIALGTVSWQSWRAAIRNPVEALRYE